MDIKARQEEVREAIAIGLFENEMMSTDWDALPEPNKNLFRNKARRTFEALNPLVMLVDKEAELPKLPEALTVEYVIYDDMDDTEVFYDEEALDKAGYVKAYPLEER